MKKMTREEMMGSNTVHNLTKFVLTASKGKDVVDRYYAVKLALEVLREEMIEALPTVQG